MELEINSKFDGTYENYLEHETHQGVQNKVFRINETHGKMGKLLEKMIMITDIFSFCFSQIFGRRIAL